MIVERQAHVDTGHEHTQLAAIRAMVPQAELRLISAARGGQTDPGAILSARRATKKAAARSLEHDIAALKRYVAGGPSSSVTLVIPSANGFEVRLVLGLLDALSAHARFSLRFLRPEDVDILSNEEIAKVRKATEEGRVTLHTETEELKTYIWNTHHLKSEDDFLLPCNVDPEGLKTPRAKPVDSAYRIGFLGLPRREKGARLLPGILQEVASLRLSREVVFSLQKPTPSGLKLSPRHYVWACNRAVKRKRGVAINWLKESLSDDEYREVLGSQDLLLLPYLPSSYAYRGSGVIIDGVLSGTPILHSKGIGMGQFLQHNAYPAESAEEFAHTIERLVDAPLPLHDSVIAARRSVTDQLKRTKELFATMAEEHR